MLRVNYPVILEFLCSIAAPRNQFKKYYREGRFDRCGERFADVRFCAELRSAGDERAIVRAVQHGAVAQKRNVCP